MYIDLGDTPRLFVYCIACISFLLNVISASEQTMKLLYYKSYRARIMSIACFSIPFFEQGCLASCSTHTVQDLHSYNRRAPCHIFLI